MSNLSAELALAAADAADIADRLTEPERAELVREWTRLTDSVDGRFSDGAAVIAVLDWRQSLRGRYRASPRPAKLTFMSPT